MTDTNKPQLNWEQVDNSGVSTINRAKVFGGWLVCSITEVNISFHEDMTPQTGYEWRESICFVPDVNHEWDKPKVCKHENKVEGERHGLITDISCLDCGEQLYKFDRIVVNTHQADMTEINLSTKTSK